MSLNKNAGESVPEGVAAGPEGAGQPGASRAKRWLARFGVAGFLFFFVKGLLWLLVPGAIALWAAR